MGGTRISQKAGRFSESVIREMTRRCIELHGDEAVNFAQGFPDFDPPAELLAAAARAMQGGFNQYATTWGAPQLRQAIARNYSPAMGRPIDPDREVTVTCGSTEAMIATMLGLVDPGEEVIVLSPFYENYGPDCILTGAVPRYVTLREPGFDLDPEELAAAFNERTRAIIINTPNNPTGKVFSRAELELVAGLCRDRGVLAITDEIYEHLVYEGEHVHMATLPGMSDLTVTISGLSKTYSLTGWRVGWITAAPALTDAIRKVHDFLTVGAAHPLQVAAADALAMPESYYATFLADYRARRDLMVGGLEEIGFRCSRPQGAYYVMADIDRFGFADDFECANYMIEKLGVATVPASSFYHRPELGAHRVRFSYPKRLSTIERGLGKLEPLRLRAEATAPDPV